MRVKRLICAFVVLGLVACASGGKNATKDSDASVPTSDQKLPGPINNGGGPEIPSLVTVYFDYDDSALRPDAKDGLKRNAEFMRSNRDVKAELQGNCDSRGTEEYNLALGKRRAEAAKQYLTDLGIAPQRLITVSFGEENPAAPGESEAAWAKNRRVDFNLR
jgi:peptidoglycan-associated lipoprotein